MGSASMEADQKARWQHDDTLENDQSSRFVDEKGEVKPQGDYSGAVAKTNPREIKLVRKLDTRMMPIIWAMYFLNYVSPSPGDLCPHPYNNR